MTHAELKNRRLRFLRQLRTMETRCVRNLLRIETQNELQALRDLCFPEGDEALRSVIEQERDAMSHLHNTGMTVVIS